MAECPWCHGQLQSLSGPCPKCGKLASDLRKKDSDAPPKASVPPTFDADLDLGGPDLQLDLSPVSKPVASAPPPAHPDHDPFEDDLGAGPSLELDTTGGSLPPRISSPSLHPAPVSRPSQRTPPPAAPAALPGSVAPYEARVLADYGPSPEAFWQAPFYAFRVMSRRKELRRQLAQKKHDEERSSQKAEDALVAFGERVRAHVSDGPLLDRVRAAEDLLRSRDSALAGTMDAHRAELAAIDGRLAPAHAELTRARKEEAAAQSARDAADADVKRADAKLKRLDIEMRNGGAGRDGDRATLASEHAQQAQRLLEAEGALTEARRRTAGAQARCDVIEAERTAQEGRFARQTGTRGEGVADAHRQLREALAALGRSMLEDRSLAELGSARDEATRLRELAASNSKSVALHESALGAYERPKVYLGLALIGVALLLVVVVVLFPFIYRALVVPEVASPPA